MENKNNQIASRVASTAMAVGMIAQMSVPAIATEINIEVKPELDVVVNSTVGVDNGIEVSMSTSNEVVEESAEDKINGLSVDSEVIKISDSKEFREFLKENNRRELSTFADTYLKAGTKYDLSPYLSLSANHDGFCVIESSAMVYRMFMHNAIDGMDIPFKLQFVKPVNVASYTIQQIVYGEKQGDNGGLAFFGMDDVSTMSQTTGEEQGLQKYFTKTLVENETESMFSSEFFIIDKEGEDAGEVDVLDRPDIFHGVEFVITYYNEDGQIVDADGNLMDPMVADFSETEYMEFALMDLMGTTNMAVYPYDHWTTPPSPDFIEHPFDYQSSAISMMSNTIQALGVDTQDTKAPYYAFSLDKDTGNVSMRFGTNLHVSNSEFYGNAHMGIGEKFNILLSQERYCITEIEFFNKSDLENPIMDKLVFDEFGGSEVFQVPTYYGAEDVVMKVTTKVQLGDVVMSEHSHVVNVDFTASPISLELTSNSFPDDSGIIKAIDFDSGSTKITTVGVDQYTANTGFDIGLFVDKGDMPKITGVRVAKLSDITDRAEGVSISSALKTANWTSFEGTTLDLTKVDISDSRENATEYVIEVTAMPEGDEYLMEDQYKMFYGVKFFSQNTNVATEINSVRANGSIIRPDTNASYNYQLSEREINDVISGNFEYIDVEIEFTGDPTVLPTVSCESGKDENVLSVGISQDGTTDCVANIHIAPDKADQSYEISFNDGKTIVFNVPGYLNGYDITDVSLYVNDYAVIRDIVSTVVDEDGSLVVKIHDVNEDNRATLKIMSNGAAVPLITGPGVKLWDSANGILKVDLEQLDKIYVHTNRSVTFEKLQMPTLNFEVKTPDQLYSYEDGVALISDADDNQYSEVKVTVNGGFIKDGSSFVRSMNVIMSDTSEINIPVYTEDMKTSLFTHTMKQTELCSVADFEALKAAIVKAEAKSTAGCTKATVDILKKAIKDAKDMVSANTASQFEADSMKADLDKAVGGLVSSKRIDDMIAELKAWKATNANAIQRVDNNASTDSDKISKQIDEAIKNAEEARDAATTDKMANSAFNSLSASFTVFRNRITGISNDPIVDDEQGSGDQGDNEGSGDQGDGDGDQDGTGDSGSGDQGDNGGNDSGSGSGNQDDDFKPVTPPSGNGNQGGNGSGNRPGIDIEYPDSGKLSPSDITVFRRGVFSKPHTSATSMYPTSVTGKIVYIVMDRNFNAEEAEVKFDIEPYPASDVVSNVITLGADDIEDIVDLEDFKSNDKDDKWEPTVYAYEVTWLVTSEASVEAPVALVIDGNTMVYDLVKINISDIDGEENQTPTDKEEDEDQKPSKPDKDEDEDKDSDEDKDEVITSVIWSLRDVGEEIEAMDRGETLELELDDKYAVSNQVLNELKGQRKTLSFLSAADSDRDYVISITGSDISRVKSGNKAYDLTVEFDDEEFFGGDLEDLLYDSALVAKFDFESVHFEAEVSIDTDFKNQEVYIYSVIDEDDEEFDYIGSKKTSNRGIVTFNTSDFGTLLITNEKLPAKYVVTESYTVSGTQSGTGSTTGVQSGTQSGTGSTVGTQSGTHSGTGSAVGGVITPSQMQPNAQTGGSADRLDRVLEQRETKHNQFLTGLFSTLGIAGIFSGAAYTNIMRRKNSNTEE